MSAEHQEYCDKKVYPLIEKLVTETLVARPELPVPFMVKWLSEESKKTIPTQKILLKEEIDRMEAQIEVLKKQFAKLNEAVWILTIGPDFDTQTIERQKGVNVLDTARVLLKGWRLAFTAKGIPMVEPAFINAEPGDELDELHGVAYQISRDQLHLVDAAESGWERKTVQLETYQGSEMEGYVYTARPRSKVEEQPPSERYLAVIVKAFREAELAADYVDEVSKTATYKVGRVTLKARADLPPMEELREISLEELADIGDVDQAAHVSILGYIFRVPKAKIFVGSHRGRDVTARVLRQWRGEPEKGDDKGKPPYPNMDLLDAQEQEYVRQWLDHYIWAGGSGAVVGFLSEFRQQLEFGEATLPESYEGDQVEAEESREPGGTEQSEDGRGPLLGRGLDGEDDTLTEATFESIGDATINPNNPHNRRTEF